MFKYKFKITNLFMYITVILFIDYIYMYYISNVLCELVFVIYIYNKKVSSGSPCAISLLPNISSPQIWDS